MTVPEGAAGAGTADSAEPGAETVEQDWQGELRARGYRLTPQRELVLAAVESLGHATPEQVFAEVRTRSAAINLSTVYRTLELLNEIGVIRHAHIENRTPTYHSTRGHAHFHLVCHHCGRVVTASAADAEDFARQVRERHDGFAVDVGHLTVFGTCPECAEV